MPQKDGTGPQGKGPKTGRGMGKCVSTQDPVQRPKNPPRDGRGGGKMRGGARSQRSS
jgi:hypothetical protein